MSMSPRQAFNGWFNTATLYLCDYAKQRLRKELCAHFDAALAEARAEGVDDATARDRALATLGKPGRARRRFMKTYLTERQASFLDGQVRFATSVLSPSELWGLVQGMWAFGCILLASGAGVLFLAGLIKSMADGFLGTYLLYAIPALLALAAIYWAAWKVFRIVARKLAPWLRIALANAGAIDFERFLRRQRNGALCSIAFLACFALYQFIVRLPDRTMDDFPALLERVLEVCVILAAPYVVTLWTLHWVSLPSKYRRCPAQFDVYRRQYEDLMARRREAAAGKGTENRQDLQD